MIPSKLEFRSNETITIGVELELQLVSRLNGDLNPVAGELLNRTKHKPGGLHLKSEIFQSMLEIDTHICKTAHEAGESLRSSVRLVNETAEAMEVDAIMAGTHPFAHFTERLLTPSSRYYQLMDRNQWIARRLQIFGMHVHLGMRSGEHAIQMTNALCHYLPMILSLSASSPYWEGIDTGLASCRITFFEAIPTGGHPCLMANWQEFEILIQKLYKSKAITSIKDLWWDIRPNLEYGTVEIRIADCPPTIQEAEALVALMHSLALFIDKDLKAGKIFSSPPDWILRENKWRASRHGVEADFIHAPDGTTSPFREMWSSLSDSLSPVIKDLQYEGYFSFLNQLIEKGPSYVRQRLVGLADHKKLVQSLHEEFVNNCPKWT